MQQRGGKDVTDDKETSLSVSRMSLAESDNRKPLSSNQGQEATTASSKTSSKGLFWPQDLLPEVVPASRIFTWGYDVDVNHVLSSAGQATTFQHAQTLLSDLADQRLNSEDVSRVSYFVLQPTFC